MGKLQELLLSMIDTQSKVPEVRSIQLTRSVTQCLSLNLILVTPEVAPETAN